METGQQRVVGPGLSQRLELLACLLKGDDGVCETSLLERHDAGLRSGPGPSRIRPGRFYLA